MMAEEDKNLETLKDCHLNLQKTLECPICLDVVKYPFKLCASGHLMCVSCLKSCTSCPMCEGDLILENPVCIKNLLENVPRSCQYSDNGCKRVFPDGDDHERFCGFRQIECKIDNCGKYILAKDILKHHKKEHPKTLIIDEEEMTVFLGKNKLPATTISSSSNLVHLFDNLFWFERDINDDQAEFTLEAIPIGKLEGDYYLKLGFLNGNFEYTYTLKSLIAGEDKKTSDDKSEIRNARPNYCMTVPVEMLPHLKQENGYLQCNLSFFKH